MKRITKLTLTELKENAESVLKKDELRSITGGFQTCSKTLPDPYGSYCQAHPNDPDCFGTMPRVGVGYLVNCYRRTNGSFVGTACHVNGPCDSQYVDVTCGNAYQDNTLFGYCAP